MILPAFVFIGNPIRQAMVSLWIIVFLATTNHGTYLPFSSRALPFLGLNRQSCSRAQPNHPEIGSITALSVQQLFRCVFGSFFHLLALIPAAMKASSRVQCLTCSQRLPLSPGNCSWPETEPGWGSSRVWVFAPVLM